MMKTNYFSSLLLVMFALLISFPAISKPLAQNLVIELSDKVKMEFVLIPSGTFDMNSKDRVDRAPSKVTLTRSYYMGKYELTQAQWLAVMGSWPVELYYKEKSYHFTDYDEKQKKDILRPIKHLGIGNNYPVYWISWFEAIEFCNALSFSQGLKPCYEILPDLNVVWKEDSDGYRLPTDAEWEYAAGGGTNPSKYYWGNEMDADYAHEAFMEYQATQTRFIPVGQKLPNKFGLYDIIGNVDEWCWDIDFEETRPVSTVNPRGPHEGVESQSGWPHPRVVRGSIYEGLKPIGSTSSNPDYEKRDASEGFRVVRTAK